LSHDFTAYVLGVALAQVRTWLDDGIALPVAVNVSPRCLLDERLPDTIAEGLQSAGLPGEMLCLEITEDTVMANHERAVRTLHRIRLLGVRVSVDDFGTGYSSITYLKRLPVDELKIDRSFVTDLDSDDPRDRRLVSSMITLAHDLDLSVVAEGVETEPALTALKSLGCDIAQGYYFARPLDPAQLRTWLSDNPFRAPSRETFVRGLGPRGTRAGAELAPSHRRFPA
jgi:EAL domain-containing protein (putative c-di-GMP-specific phosphodiesterase class I)